MKFLIELDLPESKLALTLEFLKSLSFVKNVRTISSTEIPNALEREKPLKIERPFGLLKGTIHVPVDFNEPFLV